MYPEDDDPDPATSPALSAQSSPGEMVAHARERHGFAGAVLAGAMVGLQQVLDPKPRENPAVVVEASGEPTDIDRDGISVTAHGVTLHAQVEPGPPVATPAAARRTRPGARPRGRPERSAGS